MTAGNLAVTMAARTAEQMVVYSAEQMAAASVARLVESKAEHSDAPKAVPWVVQKAGCLVEHLAAWSADSKAVCSAERTVAM